MSPTFVKLLLPLMLPHFTYIFNTAITTSSFPTIWKNDKILPIPKLNNSYRPILTMNHNILCTKLRNMFNFSTNATKLIRSYLTNRYQAVVSGTQVSSLQNLARGVPQGSVLGKPYYLFNKLIPTTSLRTNNYICPRTNTVFKKAFFHKWYPVMEQSSAPI